MSNTDGGITFIKNGYNILKTVLQLKQIMKKNKKKQRENPAAKFPTYIDKYIFSTKPFHRYPIKLFALYYTKPA